MNKKINWRRILLAILLVLVVYILITRFTGGSVTPPSTQGQTEASWSLVDPTGSGESQVQTEPQTQPQTSQAATQPQTTQAPTQPQTTEAAIAEDGRYSSKEDVALYLHTYGHLPSNFITKEQARALGWSGGSVEKYKDGAAIGGDNFGNREGSLPKASGRKYRECDIDTHGSNSRGAKRLIYSNDGLFFYTADHYESFVEIQVTQEGEILWK